MAKSLSEIFNSSFFLAAVTGAYLAAFYCTNNLTLLSPGSLVLLVTVFMLPPLAALLLLKFASRLLPFEVPEKFLLVFSCVGYLLVALNLPVIQLESVQSLLDQFGGLASAKAKLVYALGSLLIAVILGFIFRRDSRVLAAMLCVMLLGALLPNFMTTLNPDSPQEVLKKLAPPLMVDDPGFAQTPNIYLLIADGYASFAYMEDNEIEQERFLGFLNDSGFRVYHDTFSNYQPTTAAMAAMLNSRHHYYAVSRKADEIVRPGRVSIGGKNALVRLLQRNGYQVHYIHQSSYLLTQGCFVDSCFPAERLVGAGRILATAIPGIQWAEAKWNLRPTKELNAEIEKRLATLAVTAEPVFMYVHLYQPSHAPNSVQGSCEEPRQLPAYANRVKVTGRVLEEMIGRITSVDPGAVIVLAGDHGPMISNQCNRKTDITSVTEFRDRAGALLAIRWPESYDGSYDGSIRTSINVFRYVLGSLLADDRVITGNRAAEDVFVRGSGQLLKIMEDGHFLAEPVVLEEEEMQLKFDQQAAGD